jgi:hypothetical protein
MFDLVAGTVKKVPNNREFNLFFQTKCFYYPDDKDESNLIVISLVEAREFTLSGVHAKRFLEFADQHNDVTINLRDYTIRGLKRSSYFEMNNSRPWMQIESP